MTGVMAIEGILLTLIYQRRDRVFNILVYWRAWCFNHSLNKFGRRDYGVLN